MKPGTNLSLERVLKACAFQPPDRIPRFDGFWEYPDEWQQTLGTPEDLTDIEIWVPDEGTFPTRAQELKREADGTVYEVESWGRTIRRREGAYFFETLEVPLPPDINIDSVIFEPADLDLRYLQGASTLEEAARKLETAKARHCVFGKTGGPYIRSTQVRGVTQFLIDIASDPGLAKAIADKVADHLIAVGLQEIQRWALQDTGIWIYDDMGANDGPMFKPKSFEVILLPAYQRMVQAYKGAGAKYVFLHSDGDIRCLLDMLVDAGIDGLNPLERRANMDLCTIRKQYPKLILAGGMDNTDTLINGPVDKIEREAREIIDMGRDGGIIIGTHSISPEIPLKFFSAYDQLIRTYGRFSEGET